jgi:hypothetical protein
MSLSQMLWAASLASAASSGYLRQMDQIKGAYRSTSASHACRSPLRARFTRSATTGSTRLRLASSVRLGFVVMVVVAWRIEPGGQRVRDKGCMRVAVMYRATRVPRVAASVQEKRKWKPA